MKKSIIIIIVSIIFFFLPVDCREKTIHLGKGINFKKEENIHYGKELQQVFDLYIPQGNSIQQRDIFIIIHGGGWRSGDKSQLTFFTLSMMQKFPDHIFANINYRLASAQQYAIPNQMDDIQEVILFLKKKFNTRPNVILLGNSAGGYLSMLYAYHFDSDRYVKSVINIVGPADLTDTSFTSYEDYPFVEKHLIDPKFLPQGISAVHFASPAYWINKKTPPTLSYYGKTDRVIPMAQKNILDSLFFKNKVMSESYAFNGGHLDWDKAPHNSFLIDKIDRFLRRIDQK
ncbi:alpha/beta hydrolase [Chryseobacterium sp.]|uniref:alpha/beta hydrolase n=1 Tax=Chryseobacterium sp. TaxID=1871047 RepID=UPI0025C1073A|nr:alpha/beta hydrolase [Chryseobacterium sp.]MBV8324841.1 alpha/beta hydrolase [Chryseobacterium sp.]